MKNSSTNYVLIGASYVCTTFLGMILGEVTRAPQSIPQETHYLQISTSSQKYIVWKEGERIVACAPFTPDLITTNEFSNPLLSAGNVTTTKQNTKTVTKDK